MNIKELNQLIESNRDLTIEDKRELYDLFLSEHAKVFDTAYSVSEESGDELDGVDLLIDTYVEWIEDQETEETLEEIFINRTMEDMSENFWAALT
jgi:hypothetical protein